MNLRDRLRLLRPAATRGSGSAQKPPDSTSTLAFGSDIEIQSFSTQSGQAFGTEKIYLLSHKQGIMSMDPALSIADVGWRRLLPMVSERFPIERAVFLDLETTGLSRGAGTYAFLIGVGRFVDGGFRLRQFFMRDYDDERNVLEALQHELADANAIVTFNGRAFDWPLLETRATLNRLRLPRMPHLDLLHLARRLWRPIIGGCSLSELEEQVLGLKRYDDVPGHIIPQLYFDFLQTGEVSPLAGVLLHNRLDILSMVALTGYMGHAMAEPRNAAPGGKALSGAELYTIGRLLLPESEGIACLEEALYRGLSSQLRRQCSRLLATSYRRTRRFDDAVVIWEELTADDGLSTWAYIELAKYYEHRARDLRTARQWTKRALDLVVRRRSLVGATGGEEGTRCRLDEELGAIVHRLQRIERKLGS